MYLSYTGIRVTDLEESLAFYTERFGLERIAGGDNQAVGAGIYALLRDPRSGQKLELNWYPEGSRYAAPYEPGEGLDHLSFRVESVPETLERLRGEGVEVVDLPPEIAQPDPSFMVGYVKDPDGNWIELYHNGGDIEVVGKGY